jgi:hypothetical protein
MFYTSKIGLACFVYSIYITLWLFQRTHTEFISIHVIFTLSTIFKCHVHVLHLSVCDLLILYVLFTLSILKYFVMYHTYTLRSFNTLSVWIFSYPFLYIYTSVLSIYIFIKEKYRFSCASTQWPDLWGMIFLVISVGLIRIKDCAYSRTSLWVFCSKRFENCVIKDVSYWSNKSINAFKYISIHSSVLVIIQA